MVQLTLSTEDAAILHEVLESYLSDLRMEIADTDALDYRDRLKRRETTLKKLIQELQRENA